MRLVALWLSVASAILCSAHVSLAEDKTTVADLVKQFDASPDAAKSAVGQKYTFEIQVAGTATSGGQSYYRIKTESKSARLLISLSKELTVNDKLLVTATVKSAIWNNKDGRKIVFDPATIDEEISIAPPQFTAEQFVTRFIQDPIKMAERFKGKPVRLVGHVTLSNGVPDPSLQGKPMGQGNDTKTTLAYLWINRGWTKYGKSFTTVAAKFADVDGKPFLPRNNADIKIEGVVEEMSGTSITVKDAKIVK